jgi:hypothetical protein
MGSTLSHSIIYETAEARDVWREMPSLEMLTRMSLFSVLVLSPSVLGYDSTWQREADELSQATEAAERLARKADESR